MADKIAIDRASLLRALEHLEVIVPSFDRIGAAAAAMSDNDYRQAIVEFIHDWDVVPRLAEARRLLAEAIDYDEEERLFGGLQGWRANQRKPR